MTSGLVRNRCGWSRSRKDRVVERFLEEFEEYREGSTTSLKSSQGFGPGDKVAIFRGETCRRTTEDYWEIDYCKGWLLKEADRIMILPEGS